MRITVLKNFPYAHDFVRVRELVAGKVEEIRDDVVDGLEKAGLISKEVAEQPGADAPGAEDGAGSAGQDVEALPDPAGGAGSADPAEGFVEPSTGDEVEAAEEQPTAEEQPKK